MVTALAYLPIPSIKNGGASFWEHLTEEEGERLASAGQKLANPLSQLVSAGPGVLTLQLGV